MKSEKKSKKRKESIAESTPSKKRVKDEAADDASGDEANDTKPKQQYAALSIIAHPLADKKLHKKCLKLVKRAAKAKSLRRGVKEVVKAVRKGGDLGKGIMIIAGNITPIDVVTHLPVMAEDRSIPYIYVSSKEELGLAAATKRPTSVVLVQTPGSSKKADKKEDYSETFEEVKQALLKVQPVLT